MSINVPFEKWCIRIILTLIGSKFSFDQKCSKKGQKTSWTAGIERIFSGLVKLNLVYKKH